MENAAIRSIMELLFMYNENKLIKFPYNAKYWEIKVCE